MHLCSHLLPVYSMTAFRRRQLRLQCAFHHVTVCLQSWNIRKVNEYKNKNDDNEIKRMYQHRGYSWLISSRDDIASSATVHLQYKYMTLPEEQSLSQAELIVSQSSYTAPISLSVRGIYDGHDNYWLQCFLLLAYYYNHHSVFTVIITTDYIRSTIHRL